MTSDQKLTLLPSRYAHRYISRQWEKKPTQIFLLFKYVTHVTEIWRFPVYSLNKKWVVVVFLRRGCLRHEVNKQTVWTTVYVLSISMYLGCIRLKNMKVYMFHKIVLVFQTSCICGSKFIFVSDPFFHNSSSGFKKLFWIVTSVSDVNIR